MRKGILLFWGGIQLLCVFSAYSATQIDVLFGFDNMSVSWIASDGSSMEEFAGEQVNLMNQILANSQLSSYFNFRLAGITSVNASICDGEIDSGLIGTRFVQELQKMSDGQSPWSGLAKERDAKRADIVVVFTDTGSQYGIIGLGNGLRRDGGYSIAEFSPYAYCICSIQAAKVGYVVMHEVGHIMGCGHPDVLENGFSYDFGPQYFEYSSGMLVGNNHVTVMGYEGNGYTCLPCFSSPDLTYEGLIVGDAAHDNRRTLLETYSEIADYRKESAVMGGEGNVFNGVNGDFAKAMVLMGTLRNQNGDVLGTLQLKVGKRNERKNTSKVAGSVMLLDGKKCAIKAQTVVMLGGRVAFSSAAKGLGVVELQFDGAGVEGIVGEYRVSTALVGGKDEKTAFLSFNSEFAVEIAGGVVNQDFLPEDEPITMTMGKWKCSQTAAIKYGRDKETGTLGWIVNNGREVAGKTNKSGLKFTYKSQDGSFKGSFNVYSLVNQKMKKTKVSVSGVYVDGVGWGVAKTKGRDSRAWTFTVR